MSAPRQQSPARSAPPAPPAPPSPPGPFVVRGGDVASVTAPPMTRQDVAALQARRSELNGQLESAVRQRRQISEQIRRANGVDKAGLESRIGVVDARITHIEGELDQVSEQLASTEAARAVGGVVVRNGGPNFRNFNMNPEPIVLAFIFFVMCPIALSISRLVWKRGSLKSQPALTSDSGQRLERIEQAMDAIAIEVERVSEGQRFVTRLLSERGSGALGTGQPGAEPVRIPLSDAERVR